MSSDSSGCTCNGGLIFDVVPCRGCGKGNCGEGCDIVKQKIIWNSVRVPASEYTMNLGSLSVYQPPLGPTRTNWCQMSDRIIPHQQSGYVPRIGSSGKSGRIIHSSRTRLRPGCLGPAGKGVDIKHNSYARYLARLKGKGPLRTETVAQAEYPPLYGNKTRMFGIVGSNGTRKAGACLCLTTH